MRQLSASVATGIIVLALTGCFGGNPATQPSASEPALSPAETVEPVPSADLGPISCELPVHVDATVPRANIVDVRVGAHADADRVVFEFGEGIPEASLERVEPPFTQDASGMPIEVEGSSFLRLIMRGGTKQTEDGSSSYHGPTEFAPGFSTLLHLVEGGDFEGQSTWYLGLDSDACTRVTALTDGGAPRLVIDVEH